MDHQVHQSDENGYCGVADVGILKATEKDEGNKGSESPYEAKQDIPGCEHADDKIGSSFSGYVDEKTFKEGSEVSDQLEGIKTNEATSTPVLVADGDDDKNNQEKTQFCDQSGNNIDNTISLVQCLKAIDDANEEKDHKGFHSPDHSKGHVENQSPIQIVESNRHIILGDDISDKGTDREHVLEKNISHNIKQVVDANKEEFYVSISEDIKTKSSPRAHHEDFEARADHHVAANEEIGRSLPPAEVNVGVEELQEKCTAEGIKVDMKNVQDISINSNAETNEKKKGEIPMEEESGIAEELLDVVSVSAGTSICLAEDKEEETRMPVVNDLIILKTSIVVNVDDESNTNRGFGSMTTGKDGQEACMSLYIDDKYPTLSGPNSECNEKKQEQSQSVFISGEANGNEIEKCPSGKIDSHEIKQEMIGSEVESGALHVGSASLESVAVVDELCTTGIKIEETFTEERAVVYMSPSSTLPTQFNSPIDDEVLKDRKGKRIQGNKVKIEVDNTLFPAFTEASSSVLQQGNDSDRDGGSSLDSTAGSGHKVKGSIQRINAEDTNSSDGEDSATSPAICVQHSQQRKTINIHHQFVREIVKIQHDREQYDKEQVERQMQAQQSANLSQVDSKILENKEHATNLARKRHSRIDTQFVQKTLNSQSNETRSKQKHSVEIKRASFLQTKSGSSQSDECREIATKTSIQVDDTLRNKGSGRLGRGKHRSISIYRPPVARESAKGSQGQHNAEVADFSYNETATYVRSSSDGSTGLALDAPLPQLESLNLGTAGGGLKVVKNSSGERYVHSVESEGEASMPGMSIKVTFDTQKKMRHIEFSESSDVLDSATDCKQSERVSSGSLSFKSSENTGIGPHINQNPSIHINQDLGTISSSSINKRQVVRLPKESDKISWPGNSSNVVLSDIGREGKGAQIDNVQQSSLASNKLYSKSLHSPKNASHSGDDASISEAYHSDTKMPNSLLRGFNMSGSPNSGSVKKGQSFEQLYNNTLQSMDALHLSMDVQSALRSLQSNTKTDSRGKQKLAGSGSGGKKKRESNNRIRESRSRAKDFEVPHGSPSQQFEIEAPRLEPQPSPLPSKDNLFYSSPMLEKWGDIVDDLPDSYDLPKVKDGEKEDHLRERFCREASGNKGASVQDDIFQQNRPSPSPVPQDSSGHTRKSVWERLGPQNDKGSILGPPPKNLENRMANKPSPEVYRINNTPSTVLRSLDSGFQGVPEMSYHDAVSFPNEEGLETVLQGNTGIKQKRSKRELYVPRRGV